MAAPTFEQLKHVHIVGVCGTLMGAFAAFLKRRGIRVTGSDQNVYPPMSDVLKNAGVELFSPYDSKNLSQFSAKPDLVVIGNVISAGNPEAKLAFDEKYHVTSLPEAMERLILPQTRNLVVAGTHGKTTTSSLLAYTLVQAGMDPGYFIGGVSHDLPYSFQVPALKSGTPFVLEGDEYDTAFWDKVPKFNHYLPNDVILTSVEFDHADIYADIAAVTRAFQGLVVRVRQPGRWIACTDYPIVRELTTSVKGVDVITYGSQGTPARFQVTALGFAAPFTEFTITDDGKKLVTLKMQLTGHHNALNATAVYLECRALGISDDKIRAAFESFQGVKRRQEVRGEKRGVMVIDDFAHHPTAVRETLKALKLKYPGKRIVAVFEPRSATSRRKVFQKEYGEAFMESDFAFIAAPHDQTKIAAADQFSSDQLVSDIERLGRPARLMPTVDEGVGQVAREAKSGDLVAVLSNGGFGGFIPKLLEKL